MAEALQKIQPIAEAHKASFTQTVIQWTIHQPGITAALVGARDAKQAEHNARAMDFTFSNDELAAIGAIFEECAKQLTK